jgi:hypothetical protein
MFIGAMKSSASIRQHPPPGIPQGHRFTARTAIIAGDDLGPRINQRQLRPAKKEAIAAELGHVRLVFACSPPEQSTQPRRRHAI